MKLITCCLSTLAFLFLQSGTVHLHRITHVENINSDRVFVTDVIYDSIGRRIRQTNGVLDQEGKGHHGERIRETFVTTIRYQGDSIINTFESSASVPSRIAVLVRDRFGNYIGAGSQVQYDSSGHVTLEKDTAGEAHSLWRGDDMTERYGWSRRAGVASSYHCLFTYYPEYDTRSYGAMGEGASAGHLLHSATYMYAGYRRDTIVNEYSYDFGTDGRVLTERRTERNSSMAHAQYWTARYTYDD